MSEFQVDWESLNDSLNRALINMMKQLDVDDEDDK